MQGSKYMRSLEKVNKIIKDMVDQIEDTLREELNSGCPHQKFSGKLEYTTLRAGKLCCSEEDCNCSDYSDNY